MGGRHRVAAVGGDIALGVRNEFLPGPDLGRGILFVTEQLAMCRLRYYSSDFGTDPLSVLRLACVQRCSQHQRWLHFTAALNFILWRTPSAFNAFHASPQFLPSGLVWHCLRKKGRAPPHPTRSRPRYIHERFAVCSTQEQVWAS